VLVARLLDWIRTPPEELGVESARSYLLAQSACVLCVFIHAFYVVLFASLGVAELALVNVFSVALFLLLVVLTRRGHVLLAMTLTSLEVILHSALCVHVIGWQAGVQYGILTIPVGATIPGGDRRYWRFGLLFTAAVSYLALESYAAARVAPWQQSPEVLETLKVAMVLSLVFLLWFHVAFYKRIVSGTEARLQEEFQRSERLLRNIFPESVAAELKGRGKVSAKGFESASVLFCDIVGFTPLAMRVSPERLVAMLNAVFSRFDELCELRGVEKIKTIGDAYMVAAGIPEARPDHAQALVELAIDMVENMEALRTELGEDLRIRVGVNSGPVVAGVIGKKRFIYDLWGDTVNTASRMESHGLAGEIQITELTRDLIGDRFLLEERGTIEVKGKGSMRVSLVRGRAAPQA
jgi:adenylate cyclase